MFKIIVFYLICGSVIFNVGTGVENTNFDAFGDLKAGIGVDININLKE